MSTTHRPSVRSHLLRLLAPLGLAAVLLAVPVRAQLVAYGLANGDTALARADDSTLSITPGFSTVFMASLYTGFNINNNGSVSFGGGLPNYSNQTLPHNPIDFAFASPFYYDVDTLNASSGQVYYRTATGTLTGAFATLATQINAKFGTSLTFDRAFVVTWDHVGYYSAGNQADKLDTFQIAYVGNATRSFIYFNYGAMQNGSTPSGSAVAGFDAGNGANYLSTSANIATLPTGSNIGVAGSYLYRVDQISVSQPPVIPVPEPSTYAALAGLAALGMVVIRRRRAA